MKRAVERVVGMVVRGDYDGLIELAGGQGTPEELREHIESYPASFVMPPPEAYEEMDIVGVSESSPPAFSVWMPLWSEEEGRSDLTLQLTIIDPDGDARVELDNVRVP